jgi:hypothetical protein
METINFFYLPRLRNGENLNFHFESVEQLDRANPDLLGVAEQTKTYRVACEGLKRSVDVFSASELSAESTRLDMRRDRAYSASKAFLKLCLNDEDETKAEVAERIITIFRNTEKELGHPINVGLAKESVIISSLLRNLEPYSADIEQIGATDRIKRLEEANQAYIDLQFERYLEKSNKPSGDVKASRVVADTAYRTIIDRINAQILLNGDEVFAPYVKLQNTLIEKYKLLLAQQRKRPAETKETDKQENEKTESK